MEYSQLIELAAKKCVPPTKNQLCTEIDVTRQTLSKWRNGLAIPKPEHAQALADLAEIDAGPIVAQSLIQATKSKTLQQTLKRFKSAVATAPALLISNLVYILCKIIPAQGFLIKSHHKPFEAV